MLRMYGSGLPLGILCALATLTFLPLTAHAGLFQRPGDLSILPFLASLESASESENPSEHSKLVQIPELGDGSVPCVHGGWSHNGSCCCPDRTLYSGLACQLCQRDAACKAPENECNRSLVIRGNKKNFECALRTKFFLEVLGKGRPIEANATITFDTADGKAFSESQKGRCAFTLYRVEPKRVFTDAFFRCNMTQCSMYEGVVEDQKNSNHMSRFYKVVQLVCQILIIALCFLFVLLRCVASKIGRQRVGKVVIVTTTTLVILTLLFNGIMFIGMRLKPLEKVVVYTCRQVNCACAEDPPSAYIPYCSTSVLPGLFPSLKNGIRFTCSLRSSMCKLTLSDIALVFDFECSGSECLDTKKYPIPQDTLTDETQLRFFLFFLLVVVVLALAIGSHAIWLISLTRKNSVEFARIYELIDSVPEASTTSLSKNARKETNATASSSASSLTMTREINNNRESDKHNNNEEEEEVVGLVSMRRSNASSAQREVYITPENADRMESTRRLARSPFELTLTDLRYTLKGSRFASRRETRTQVILSQVSFTVHSGEVLAIMGPSGAGKTSLLDILSARKKRGRTSGTMSLNGTQVGASSRRFLRQYRGIIGYVSQEDTLLPALTVLQTIEYAARLKLPRAFSNATITSIVQHMIKVFKLEHCEHTNIGSSSMRGVSGGERRRVSIAVELLANPRILFLDEPTSGLDAVSAKRVMEVVVELAKDSPMRAYAPHFFAYRPIVIFSIHQPSQEIFELFDKLLLLSRGVSVYCGPARDAAQLLEPRVARATGDARSVPRRVDHANHAEYLMKLEEVLDDAARAELQAENVCDAENIASLLFQDNGEERVSGEDILRNAVKCRKYYANVYQQTGLLIARAASSLVSTFNLIVGHAALTGALASLMVILYREQDLDLPGSLNRAGSVTFFLLVMSLVSLSCLDQLLTERRLYVVERENGFYRSLPYLLAKVVVDILPLRVLPTLVLSSMIYFPMGFRVDGGMHFFWFSLINVLFSICMTLLVLCLGIIAGNFGSAALLSSVVILWSFVFGGMLVQSETVPVGLKPFQIISPFFLAFESLMVNELDGQACTFAPTDATGKQTEESVPIMCIQYLSNIGLKPSRFTGDVAQLGGYILLLLIIAWILLSKFTTITR